jgi:serine/threonine protein kinase/Tfp pilus assembly protein PilF
MDKELRAGTVVSHYRVVSKLGAGGMGEVYLAHDTQLERPVALKILLPEVANDQNRVRRFIQEAKAASALNHPNILTVYEIGNAEDLRYIATELIKGQTLRDRLFGEPLTYGETLEISMQIAAALDAAHDAGIVHRDIKTDNVMLRKDGFVKVLDFGLAKLSELSEAARSSIDHEGETKAQVKTMPGMVIGTVKYMSPEQARGKELDARTDIWSLGVVIYEMLAPESPFAGETPNDSIAAILTKEPPPLADSVPPELRRIVRKCLQKKKGERYQTVKDLLLDLKNLKRELEFSRQLEDSQVSRSMAGAAATSEIATSIYPQAISTERGSTTALSGRDLVGKMTHYRLLIGIPLLVLALVAFGYWYLRSPKQISSVAVLPFENASGDPSLDYLSDGVSESVIDRLSQLGQLKVIARNSSFKYRGQNPDLNQIADALGVQAIVSGRITRRGDSYVIRVELTDVRENEQLWGANFNRGVSDVFALPEEIARTVGENLKLKLSGAQEQLLVKHETQSPVAYELVLKARFHARKGGTDNRTKAIEYLNEAIVADPNYALAYAVLAARYNSLVNNSGDPREFLPKSQAAAQRALELDDGLAESHYAAGIVKSSTFDWAESEHEFKRAIELNPNLARAHGGYAQYLMIRGRHDEALVEINRAKALDPLSPVINTNIGWILYNARRIDESIDFFKKLLEIDRTYSLTHSYLADAYLTKRMFPEAIALYQAAIKMGENSTGSHIDLAVAYARSGAPDMARSILEQLQISGDYISPAKLAKLYDSLGQRDEAFAQLEKGLANHDVLLQYLGVDPSYDNLRSDQRFASLLNRLGLSHAGP